MAQAASEGKAEQIVLLDVSEVSTITDFFVVLTGSSQNHLRALAGRIEDQMRAAGVKPTNVDGYQSKGWLVLDYGNVIVHAMLEETRRYYDLERLWGDARQVEWA